MQQPPIRAAVLNLEALCCSVSRYIAKLNCLKSHRFRWSKEHPRGLDSGLCCLSEISWLLTIQQSRVSGLRFSPRSEPIDFHQHRQDLCLRLRWATTHVSGASADRGRRSPHLACSCTAGCAPLGRQEVWPLELAKVGDFVFSSKNGSFMQSRDQMNCSLKVHISLHWVYGALGWFTQVWS